ncbi:hypothetical protein FRB99_000765 [Tulasnella sp. 403]|nr:hypothetical protein FRB99_000765 [Tulasnella sp. 403]
MSCAIVPLYATRIVSYLFAVVCSAVGIAAAFYARGESIKTKDSAQGATDKLNLGIQLNIDTSDVHTAGEVEGVGQLGLLLLSLGCIALLILDGRKRYAVANAPHVRSAPWSSKTLILQFLCFVLATIFTLATSITTTVIVATREATVTAKFPDGRVMPPSLIKTFQAKLGKSPVYKDVNYLIFLATAPWFGFLASFIATIVTFVAWRHYQKRQPERSESFDSTAKY